MSTGTVQAVPCDRCRHLQLHNPGHRFIKDPLKHDHCASCLKGRKICDLPAPAPGQIQSAQPSQPTTAVASSSGFTAVNQLVIAAPRRPLPSVPMPVQGNLWNTIRIDDNQPKTNFEEISLSGRFSTALATVDGRQVKLYIKRVEKASNGLYIVQDNTTRGFADIDDDNENEEDVRPPKMAKGVHSMDEQASDNSPATGLPPGMGSPSI